MSLLRDICLLCLSKALYISFKQMVMSILEHKRYTYHICLSQGKSMSLKRITKMVQSILEHKTIHVDQLKIFDP